MTRPGGLGARQRKACKTQRAAGCPDLVPAQSNKCTNACSEVDRSRAIKELILPWVTGSTSSYFSVNFMGTSGCSPVKPSTNRQVVTSPRLRLQKIPAVQQLTLQSLDSKGWVKPAVKHSRSYEISD